MRIQACWGRHFSPIYLLLSHILCHALNQRAPPPVLFLLSCPILPYPGLGARGCSVIVQKIFSRIHIYFGLPVLKDPGQIEYLDRMLRLASPPCGWQCLHPGPLESHWKMLEGESNGGQKPTGQWRQAWLSGSPPIYPQEASTVCPTTPSQCTYVCLAVDRGTVSALAFSYECSLGLWTWCLYCSATQPM